MLPDYTRAKKEMHVILMKRLHERVRHYLGPLALKESRAFEGRQLATSTEDGKLLTSEMKELSGKIEIKVADIQSDDPTPILQNLDKMARDIAEAQSKAFFEQMSVTLRDTGQSIRAEGQPLTVEMLFQAMEAIQIEFDNEGKANKLNFFFGPQLRERVNEIFKELESNPNLQKRHDELMEKKREQWRDREASRKLVG